MRRSLLSPRGGIGGVPGKNIHLSLTSRTRAWRWLFPVAVALALGACASTVKTIPNPQPKSTMAPLYKIGPGDTLGVFVYQSPELTVQSITVGPDGRISIPLVPNLQAAGKTPVALGKEITARLSKYVKNPNVTVLVQSFHGPLDSLVRIIGPGTKPIAIPYVDHMTLLDAMVEAGGLGKFAAGNSAEIIRREGGREKIIPVKLRSLLDDGDMAENLPMRPGDIVVIPETWF